MSDLEKTLAVINQMRADRVIDSYAIGGAIAAFFYIEPGATFDVDIFVVMETGGSGLITLNPIYSYLRNLGYVEEHETILIEGWAVQFLPPINALYEEALAAPREIQFKETTTWILKAEYLMAICLQTGRAKDQARLVEFIESGIADMKVFDRILDCYELKTQWSDFQKFYLKCK